MKNIKRGFDTRGGEDMRKPLLVAIVIVLFSVTASVCYALEVETHQAINEYIAQKNVNGYLLDSYLKKHLGLQSGINEKINSRGFWPTSQEVWKWVRDGGYYEDKPPWTVPYTRSFNHFHDPLKSWNSAGFKGFWFSSILWSQRPEAMQVIGGNYSWADTRYYFYKALISKNDTDRGNYFADTFRGLGQLMHLVEDASVPAHVRNDGHPFGYISKEYPRGYHYEIWAKKKNGADYLATIVPLTFDKSILTLATDSSAPAPISNILDTNQYDGTNPNVTVGSSIGLAEYTNANFFSEDTIFTDYPHPAYTETAYPDIDWTHPELADAEDGKLDSIIYIRKTVGEAADIRLASLSYISYDCIKKGKYDFSPLVLDDNVYSDYAALLIPRAVGYSAGLLEYFFRGSIKISVPQSALYASTGDKDAGFTRVTLLAVNETSNGEEMSDGTIELVARYRTVAQDPFRALDLQASIDYFYTVVPEATGKRTIPRGTPVELVFDLDQTAIIPVNAVDVSLQVVYHGRLGNEDGAVAVGWKSISDPTPVELVNNMDKICLYGNWYDAGSQAAIDQVDPEPDGIANWDIYPHDLQNIYVEVSPGDNPVQASSSAYTFTSATLNAGKTMRTYILSDLDAQLKHSHTATVVKTTTSDVFTHVSDIFDGIWSGYALKSDVETSSDTAVCDSYGFSTPCTIRHAPPFYSFRGYYLWGPMATIFDNPKYPLDTNCKWEAL
jgi:hypothetical protein